MQTEKVIFRNTYAHTCIHMHVTTIIGKMRPQVWKNKQERIWDDV